MVKAVFYQSPVGKLILGERDGSLLWCDWAEVCDRREYELSETPLLREAAEQLENYFNGKLRRFDLPLSVDGSESRRNALLALCEIPYGATMTYGQFATAVIGKKGAARGIGQTLGSNRLSIILPCHRIVGASSLGGYRGGVGAKLFLLNLEASFIGRNFVNLQSD